MQVIKENLADEIEVRLVEIDGRNKNRLFIRDPLGGNVSEVHLSTKVKI